MVPQPKRGTRQSKDLNSKPKKSSNSAATKARAREDSEESRSPRLEDDPNSGAETGSLAGAGTSSGDGQETSSAGLGFNAA